MDGHEALFANLLALYTADSGTGGLSNTSSSAYVRHFVRQDDPSIGEDRVGNWPKLCIEIMDNDTSSFGSTKFDATVRMHVYTRRDEGFTTLNAVNERILTVFEKAALSASSTPWTLSIFVRLRGFRAPATTAEMHYVHEYRAVGGL